MLKVVDIECIRKLYFREGWPIRKIARELGHSRKTVRKALSDAGPWTYRLTQPRPSPKAGPYRDLIRQWLEEDRRAPRKQRHTARRVYERLRDEYGYDGAESTIRRVVAELRRELEMNVNGQLRIISFGHEKSSVQRSVVPRIPPRASAVSAAPPLGEGRRRVQLVVSLGGKQATAHAVAVTF